MRSSSSRVKGSPRNAMASSAAAAVAAAAAAAATAAGAAGDFGVRRASPPRLGGGGEGVRSRGALFGRRRPAGGGKFLASERATSGTHSSAPKVGVTSHIGTGTHRVDFEEFGTDFDPNFTESSSPRRNKYVSRRPGNKPRMFAAGLLSFWRFHFYYRHEVSTRVLSVGQLKSCRTIIDTCRTLVGHLSDTYRTLDGHLSDYCRTLVGHLSVFGGLAPLPEITFANIAEIAKSPIPAGISGFFPHPPLCRNSTRRGHSYAWYVADGEVV